ncbi:MAG: VCBS repeat-containing protein, partial [Lentisphaeria bacterium]|nr:VCBS repeat-containing protein [Lentisphaeria bacterium]
GGTSAPAAVDNDLDGNGLADTILRHTLQGYCGAWLTKDEGTSIGWGNLSNIGNDVKLLGMGNISGSSDSGLDIYMLNGDTVAAWVTEGGKVTGYQSLYKHKANMNVLGLADFDGDGVTDYLLRSNTGDVGCIMGNGNRWNYFQSLGKEWNIAATGDFNGDGRDDLILKHDAGFAGTWLTQENGSVKWADLDTLSGGLEIIGSGDFNGDGTDDVLLHKGNWVGAWLVEEGSVDSFMGIKNNLTSTVEDIADFDGDGIDDLRVREGSDIGVLYVKGADTTRWQYFKSVGSEWSTAFDAQVV